MFVEFLTVIVPRSQGKLLFTDLSLIRIYPPRVGKETAVELLRESGTQPLGICDDSVVKEPGVGIQNSHLFGSSFNHLRVAVAN